MASLEIYAPEILAEYILPPGLGERDAVFFLIEANGSAFNWALAHGLAHPLTAELLYGNGAIIGVRVIETDPASY